MQVVCVLSVCITVGATGVMAAGRQQSSADHQQSVQRELTAIARTFQYGLDTGAASDPAQLQKDVEGLKHLHGLVRVSAYRLEPDGAVRRVASTDPGGIGAVLDPASQDVAALVGGRTLYADERAGAQHLAEVVHAVPGSTIGVGFYQDLGGVDADLATRQQRTALVIAAGAAFAALVLALMLRRIVVGPLVELQAAMQAVRGGALHHRLNWRRRDELGQLADNFDDMAGELLRSHTQLRELALRDDLTGLANRRAAMQRLTAELDHARQRRTRLTAVLIDVDHFKAINDRWGHGAGDEVLHSFGRAADLTLGAGDLAARLGGDEFLLLLRDVDAEGATEVVNHLVALVRSLSPAAVLAGFTVSAGTATFPTDAQDGARLLEQADAALYRAKAGGRARVAV